jgi:hypothetical protein
MDTVPIHYRVNLTREVSVVNPRGIRKIVLREIKTVFFPRDAPKLKKSISATKVSEVLRRCHVLAFIGPWVCGALME